MKALCLSFFWAAHPTAVTSSRSLHCSCCNITFIRCHISLYYCLDWCWLPNSICCHSFHATFSSKHILDAFFRCVQTGFFSALLCSQPSGRVLGMPKSEVTSGYRAYTHQRDIASLQVQGSCWEKQTKNGCKVCWTACRSLIWICGRCLKGWWKVKVRLA